MMKQNNVKATLILRNDIAQNWENKNPILAKGELGAEIDTGLLKLGDGTTNFNNLNYINAGSVPVDLTNYLQKPTNVVAGNLLTIDNNGVLIDTGISAQQTGALTVATDTTLGGVYSSTNDNYIAVETTGYMKLNRVATDLLYVPVNSELILNGGTA